MPLTIPPNISGGRVLVIKLRHLGDVLLTTPVYSALKERHPDCEIDALIYDDAAALLSHNPSIAQVHLIHRDWKNLGPLRYLRKEMALLRDLRQRRYDLIVHLTDHPRGAWLCRFLHPKFSSAPRSLARGRWWRKSFTHFYDLLDRRHTVQLHLDALRCLGLQPPRTPSLFLDPGDAARHKMSAQLSREGFSHANFLVIHPTSRWTFKCWAPQRTAALLSQLAQRQIPVVLTASPDPREMAMIHTIMAHVKKNSPHTLLNLAGSLSLSELAALIAQSKVFVGFDSLPMHMASALQIPTLAMFGPSSELTWGPWQNQAIVLTNADFPCHPCGSNGCGHSRISDCLEAMPMAPVLQAIDQLWQGSAHSGVRSYAVGTHAVTIS